MGVRLHIDPALGRLAMADVRASHLQMWVKELATALAASTVHLVFSYVRAMMAAAVVDRVISVSPCQGVRLPEIAGREYYIPAPVKIHTLAAEIHRLYSAVPYVVAGCGLRPSEVFALELEHVNFLRREVHVRQQLKRLSGQPPYQGELKTRTSRRTVELPEVARLALARHIEQYPPTAIEIEDRTDPRHVHRRIAHLLSAVWRVAVRRSGLPAGFGLHGLRHYFGTLLIHGGASVKTVGVGLDLGLPTGALASNSRSGTPRR